MRVKPCKGCGMRTNNNAICKCMINHLIQIRRDWGKDSPIVFSPKTGFIYLRPAKRRGLPKGAGYKYICIMPYSNGGTRKGGTSRWEIEPLNIQKVDKWFMEKDKETQANL